MVIRYARLWYILCVFVGLCWVSTTQAATYIFVSHSMRDCALQAYFKEAQQYKAVLVMRGLYQDSFMATKAQSEALKITYNIDPDLFDRYGVTKVPVIVEDNQGTIKKVTGHIPLTEALKIFREELLGN